MKYKWNKKRIADIADINPREALPKGTLAKKVAMENLQPFCRGIPEYELCEYKGGVKFRNRDTIMARITPCLENGKTAMVNILSDDEIGFGSTEYIVFRAKGNTDAYFLYYLITSPFVREIAIKSMVGSSGRQRVQTDMIADLELPIPSLEIQRQIGGFLSAIDDKIETNTAINKNLEEQAQAIYKSWFVDFEPFGGAEPEKWRHILFEKIIGISSGKRPLKKSDSITEKENVPIVGASSVMGFTNNKNFDDKILVIGRVGTHGIVQRFNSPCWVSDNAFVITSKYYEYVYQILKKIDYTVLNRGSTQPLITQRDMKEISVVLPSEDVLQKFEQIVGTLMLKHECNVIENIQLSKLRDTLLPRLMSGEIDVSDIEI